MSDMPLVSVVIPCYNHEKYVQECIRSVIGQDYDNIELIIIDDGSIDNSVQKIKSMVPACRARFSRFNFRYRANKGLTATLNEALEWCRGKYFAAIASDDLLHINKTSILLSHIEENDNLAGVFSGCEFIDQNGLVIRYFKGALNYYSFDDIIARKHQIWAPTQLLRLKLVKDAGCYPIGLYIEDWYMWLALTKNGYTLKFLPDLLVKYRQHDTNMSKNAIKMYEGRMQVLSYFSDHRLYNYSMSHITVMAARALPCSSKAIAVNKLILAIRYRSLVIFKPGFWKCVGKLLLPCFLIKHLSDMKRVDVVK